MLDTYAATIDDIRGAAKRIAPYAHCTPVLTCSALNKLSGCELFFKCENFQKVGAFKFRGACNAIMQLTDAQAATGVVTHSSGNHAQAIALAAKLRGMDAHIVMPNNASRIKKEAVRGYGARIIECEPNTAARHTTADAVVEETGGVLIPPYDHPHIIAGQGTAALELLDAESDLDIIIAPIGGGGLMSGTCITAKALRPNITIIGAEPVGADDAARSLAADELIPIDTPDTICDGLLTSLGDMTWAIIRDHVTAILTADDDRVVQAMRLIWSRMKIIVETNSALALAIILSDEFRKLRADRNAQRVGVILTGGNVDLDNLPW